ncbi:MAG: presqualene diphosphate synthase HpnD [Chloroflexota bacterium]|nr:presqualene diphosphate synthase HpnD [Chloroflexota bacterium]MDE2898089.1 presqualene diphosphate synthase HpnD [Chloroflexota bacterium]
MDAAAAYAHCEHITRTQAGNFYWGIRLLPGPKRRALCAVYALAREIDDIGDGDLPTEAKARALGAARERLAEIGPDAEEPVLAALGHASLHLPIPLSAFGELIDGVEMDVRGTTYETFDDLVVYCRRVAGTIGRLSLGVFGAENMDRAAPLADALGVALQLTNILRDVREDYLNGRIYLPQEDLRRFECTLNPDAPPAPRYPEMIRFQTGRAAEWFDEGLRLRPMLDPRSSACAGAMAGIYRRLLQRIEKDPAAVLRGRVALPAWEKALVAAQSLAGG